MAVRGIVGLKTTNYKEGKGMIYTILAILVIIGLFIYCSWDRIVTEVDEPEIEGEV